MGPSVQTDSITARVGTLTWGAIECLHGCKTSPYYLVSMCPYRPPQSSGLIWGFLLVWEWHLFIWARVWIWYQSLWDRPVIHTVATCGTQECEILYYHQLKKGGGVMRILNGWELEGFPHPLPLHGSYGVSEAHRPRTEPHQSCQLRPIKDLIMPQFLKNLDFFMLITWFTETWNRRP